MILTKKNKLFLVLSIIFVLSSSFILFKQKEKPVLYLIGDSTVKNGKGKGDGGLWGWGNFIPEHFDTLKIKIENHALGGTSSRTFQTKGLWDSVLKKLKPGDFVIMQFGHNDASPLDDTARARGTIKGTGNESKEIYNPIAKKNEVVYTYGWYMTKFIKETKAKGAIPIVCSPVPRNNWENGKVKRSIEDYGKWSAEIAKANNVLFVNLNRIVADKYDQMGSEKVASFFPADHAHPNLEGSKLNAASVVEGIKTHKSELKKYLLKRN